jgi:hypothetical protein
MPASSTVRWLERPRILLRMSAIRYPQRDRVTKAPSQAPGPITTHTQLARGYPDFRKLWCEKTVNSHWCSTQSNDIPSREMETYHSSAPTWTFGYAILWGGFTSVLPLIVPEQYPTRAILILTSVLGLVMIALGVAIYRRRQWAAWTLVAFALFDIGTRAILRQSGFLMPIILLAFALTAAIQLRCDTRRLATAS